MTKRRTATAVTQADASERRSSAADGQGTKRQARTPPRTPEHNSMDQVLVRFSGEMGMLAGKVVHDGEVHRVRYWQYLRARETGGDAYQLVT